MDRQLVYPAQVPLETDLLNTNRNAMTALAMLTQDLIGTSTQASGFTCVPTGPATMAVQVTPGRLYSLQNLDGTAYSSLAADTTHQIVKQGILLDAVTIPCAAPSTGGFSINYLIEAAYQDTDTVPVTLPYYNSSNPAQAYAGPANSGAAQATVRKGTVVLQAKAGIAATTGTQVTPAPDAGNVGLFVVTVANGASSILAGAISTYSGNPAFGIDAGKLSFTAAGTGAVPTSVAAQLQNWPSATNLGAVGDGVTLDTTALINAQNASPFVYLPAGKTFLVGAGVNYWQFYGPGKIVRVGETYAPTAHPRTGTPVVAYNPLTFGSYETAVAGAFTINSGNAQLKTNVQVNGTSGSGYATPVGQQRDHVALFFLGAPAASVVTGASSTYTATTMTATEIGAAGAGAILPGMIVDTKHATPYSGTVQSRNGSTITVDSWWLDGASPTAGTPANGTGATINPTTFSFGANGVVSTTTTGTDGASGLEMDVFAQNSVGANASTAFDAVGLGTFTALAGYRMRGNWQIGSYAQGAGIATGFVADTTGAGFEARNVSGNGFQSRVGSNVFWSVTSLGRVSGDFRNITVNASGTYSVVVSDAVIVNASGGAVITLPAATGLTGRTFTVNANAGCTVKNQGGTTIKTLVAGTSAIFSCDGTFWY